jgi:hypothetical protein
LTQSGLFQVVQYSPEVLIESAHRLTILTIEVVERWDRIIVVLPRFHVVHTMDAVPPLADPMGLRPVVLLGVGHGLRALHLALGIAALMAFGGLKRVMNRLM